ncbi:UNVERIFIED_CONTAM: hypothetical protein Sindi_0968500 [Sesamum indicum]
MDITNFTVHKVLVDNGSSADIILIEVLAKIGLDNAKLAPVKMPLVEFGGSEVEFFGTIELPVSIGEEPRRKTLMGNNSSYHLIMKFPTPSVVGKVVCDQAEAKSCYNLSLKKGERVEKKRKFTKSSENEWENRRTERIEPIDEHKEIDLVQRDPTNTTKIGSRMDGGLETLMVAFLGNNVDMSCRTLRISKG